MKRCFQEYIAERRPFLFESLERWRSRSIDEARAERCLTPNGEYLLLDAVKGYLLGCRREAEELVAKGYEFIRLADAINERYKHDYGGGWSVGRRSTALAYLHWLKTGEPHEAALADARERFHTYYRRVRDFDRRTTNLAAPTLLFLEAYPTVRMMADRLSGLPGATARTGGLFGDALRLAMAEDPSERDRLKAHVRKRIPRQLFRWLHRGHYPDVAFVLHALFPRPEGPPSRLIETAWDHIPEIERVGGYLNWDLYSSS
jgi:hypothetical protein